MDILTPPCAVRPFCEHHSLLPCPPDVSRPACTALTTTCPRPPTPTPPPHPQVGRCLADADPEVQACVMNTYVAGLVKVGARPAGRVALRLRQQSRQAVNTGWRLSLQAI